MKRLARWKKAVIVTMSALMLPSGLSAMPVMAHGHGGGHHSSSHCATVTAESCTSSTGHHSGSHHSPAVKAKSSKKGTYCAYHKKIHKKKSSCKKYCIKHKKTHKNGKRHHVAKCI